MSPQPELSPRFYSLFCCTGPACAFADCPGYRPDMDKQRYLRHILPSARHRALLEMIVQAEEPARRRKRTAHARPRYHPFLVRVPGSNERRHMPALSCPEAARLILSEPGCVPFTENTLSHLPQEISGREFALAICRLLSARSISSRHNLQALILLTHYEYGRAGKPDQNDLIYQALLAGLNTGRAVTFHRSPRFVAHLKYRALTVAGYHLNEALSFTGIPLQHAPAGNRPDVQTLINLFIRLRVRWRTLCADPELDLQDIRRRYVLYRIFAENPQEQTFTLDMPRLYGIMLSDFCLQVLLTQRSLQRPLTRDDIIRCITEHTLHMQAVPLAGKDIAGMVSEISRGESLTCLLLT